jgi:TonB family protein
MVTSGARSLWAGIGIALEVWGFSLYRGGPVRLTRTKQRVTTVVLALCLTAAGIGLLSPPTWAQAQAQEQPKADELPRRAKLKVEPVYPEVARRMSIAGTVRLAVVVAPNGTVKSSKPVGGHPLLVNAATDAIRRWRFEPASTESSGIVEFKFQPQN